ncbi:putative invertase inhibitor [Sesamum indicum]|uniref:Invertase inhibitor n=1 Tax=Sesamum indicum TaxID=4182 RepID=A0A6I9U3E2_SESIN|nr:putative invertase inhibitor [Sesamum indicum]
MKPCSSFTPLALLLPFLIMLKAIEGQNMINSTCKTSVINDPNINYDFCTTSLQAAPASRCATLQGLGTISIRLTRDNVTDTRCFIKQLMKNQTWDLYTRQCLSDCFELFSDAVSSVEEAMRYYSAKRFDDANVQISSVMDAATTCEDGFEEKGGAFSPLTKRNNDTFQLSAVVLSVMHMVQAGSG